MGEGVRFRRRAGTSPVVLQDWRKCAKEIELLVDILLSHAILRVCTSSIFCISNVDIVHDSHDVTWYVTKVHIHDCVHQVVW